MNNKVYLLIIGILIVVCAILGYKMTQKQTQNDILHDTNELVESERKNLELELEVMLLSYDTLETTNSVLKAEMAAQKAEIEALMKKAKDRDWSIHKLKKETSTLRDIMKGYVVTIDSLNTLNQALIADVEAMTEHVADVEGKNKNLEERQETMEGMIATGQILQTTSINSNAIRLRNSGKQVETTRASKAQMLKTCFSIMENRIAKPGAKNLYMRIIAPDGKVLASKETSEQKEFEGEMQNYSVKRSIDYSNSEMDVCIFYTVEGELAPGDYKIFLYEDGKLIGSNDMSLK